MTKAEIVKTIAMQTGVNAKEVSTVVEAFMEEIRNISKNTTLVIEAHDLPAFKPCKSFIERMDNK